MKIIVLFSTFFVVIVSAKFPNFYPKVKEVQLNVNDDPGQPLFLTPLIEAGNITQAQKSSIVYLDDLKSVVSYAGYLTVNKQYNSNLFFWYFPPIKSKLEDSPVVLWLQGGPGASSLIGLFTENGPLRVLKVKKQTSLKLRQYSWNTYNSLIYIDNPVGTGYSFTDFQNGYSSNETEVGANLYNALLQFFQLFPEIKNNPFFVTGESYAGKYVPAVSYTIHKMNQNANQKINLQGLAIGNGLSDPINQLVYGDYLYQLGLVDSNGRQMFNDAAQQCRERIANGDWVNAFNTFDQLLNGDMINGSSLFANLTGFKIYFNYLHDKDYQDMTTWSEYVQSPQVRKRIHVGNKTYNVENQEVERHLITDVMQSVAPWIAELLANYRVLIYNGQLDIIVAYPLTVNYLNKLNFTSAEEYKTAKRYQWHVDQNLAGFYKVAGNLTEVLVRNAGHMVPSDQPKWAFDLISRFVQNKPFS